MQIKIWEAIDKNVSLLVISPSSEHGRSFFEEFELACQNIVQQQASDAAADQLVKGLYAREELKRVVLAGLIPLAEEEQKKDQENQRYGFSIFIHISLTPM